MMVASINSPHTVNGNSAIQKRFITVLKEVVPGGGSHYWNFRNEINENRATFSKFGPNNINNLAIRCPTNLLMVQQSNLPFCRQFV